jgi:hypothetical protein
MEGLAMDGQPRLKFSRWLPRGSDAETERMYRAIESAIESYGDRRGAVNCLLHLADVLVSEINGPVLRTDDLREDLATGKRRVHPGPRCLCGRPVP